MEKESFLKLIVDLGREKKTGILRISQDQVEKSLYLKNGKIIFVDSTLRYENLGRILVEKQKISEDQFGEVAKKVKDTGKRQGEILVEMGLLSAFEVFEALKDQLAKKIQNCFMLRDFKYEFIDGEKHIEKITEIPINVTRILIDGVQTFYTFDVLKEEGGFSKEMIPRIPQTNRAKLRDFQLKSEELKITRMLDGKRTLFTIAKDSGMEAQFVLSTVYVLNVLGIVEYTERVVKPTPKPKIDIKEPPKKEESKEKPETEEVKENKPEDKESEQSKEIVINEKLKKSPIYELYIKLDTIGYLELFGLSVKFKKESLKANYDSLIKKHKLDDIYQVYKNDELLMAEKILNKVITAYTVLKDEKQKDTYLKMRAKILQPKEPEEDNVLLAEIEINKAKMYKKKNNFSKAHEALRKAIELNDKETEYYVELADSLMTKAQTMKCSVPDEIETLLKKALSIDQNNFNIYLHLGIYYKLIDERDKAVNFFSKTMQLNPSNKRAGAELRLLDIRGDKKQSLFSFFQKKPKKGKEDKGSEEED